MKFVLPSKKIQALIIIVIACFGAYFLYKSNVRAHIVSFFTKDKSPAALTMVEGENTLSDIDTDGDMLKDWQEGLWNSDKNKADTDGDGVFDGQEVEDGRDPSIAGPNDSLSDTRGVSPESLAVFSGDVSSDPGNVTKTISESLLTQVMTAESSGQSLDEDAQARIISNALAFADPGSIPPRFTIQDIKIVESTANNMKSYGNQLAGTIIAFQQSSGSVTSTGSALAAYDSIIQSIGAIPVPGTLALNQVRLLNNLNASYQMLSIIVNYGADPAKALVAMKAFQQNTEDVKTLFKTIADEMKNNGIIFNQEEPGYIWSNY